MGEAVSGEQPAVLNVDAIHLLLDEVLKQLEEARKAVNGYRPRLLNEAQAAEYIGRSAAALRTSRSEGVKVQGPDYIKLGERVFYDIRDLDAWIDSRPRKKGSIDEKGQDSR